MEYKRLNTLIIDPLCAGLAGTWVINDDDMAARTLLANGTDMSEKDALTSAFAGKHKDSSTVSSDGTYRGATQGAKNKIDNLQQSQKAQGRSADSARLSN